LPAENQIAQTPPPTKRRQTPAASTPTKPPTAPTAPHIH
jgi:hypothetical protein